MAGIVGVRSSSDGGDDMGSKSLISTGCDSAAIPMADSTKT